MLISNAAWDALLISTFVGWVALIEHFITKVDHLTPRKFSGIGLAALGVALTVLQMGDADSSQSARQGADSPTLVGDLLDLGRCRIEELTRVVAELRQLAVE